MQITIVFVYAAGQEYGLTVDSYRLFRNESRIVFQRGKVEEEYSLLPGDRADIFAVGYNTFIKRNK